MGSTGQLGVGDDEDLEPDVAKGKQLEVEVLLVSAGGTHTSVLLARTGNRTATDATPVPPLDRRQNMATRHTAPATREASPPHGATISYLAPRPF